MIPPPPHPTKPMPPLPQGRTCIVGIGNRFRGDDGAGPCLIDAGCPASHGRWIDAGTTPENVLEQVVQEQPEHVLLVDSVDFGGPPGASRMLLPADLSAMSTSTHTISLQVVSSYLAARTRAEIRVLAIQPKSLAHRAGLSPEVETTIREWAEHLQR